MRKLIGLLLAICFVWGSTSIAQAHGPSAKGSRHQHHSTTKPTASPQALKLLMALGLAPVQEHGGHHHKGGKNAEKSFLEQLLAPLFSSPKMHHGKCR